MTLTLANLLAFSAELWVLGAALVVLGLALVRKNGARLAANIVALGGLAGAGGTLITQLRSSIDILSGSYLVDGYAIFFKALFLGAAALTLLISFSESEQLEPHAGEFPGFVLLATLGAMMMASVADLITVFVALELLSINLYVMATLVKRDSASAEAGIKYIVLGLASSAVLLYGLAILYGLTGETALSAVGHALATRGATDPVLLLALALVVGGLAFKLGVIPFHWWVPDVYEGAPLPVVAFIAGAATAAGFALFLRVVLLTFGSTQVVWPALLAILAAVTMTLGNLAALRQTGVKRLLGYATIAQAGYALTAAVALREGGLSASLFFLLASIFTNLAAFAAIIAYTRIIGSDRINDLAGMWRRTPALTLVMVLAFASLVGIPPTVGFFAKVFVFIAAMAGGFAWLALVGMLNSVLSAIYFLRVIKVACFDAPAFELEAPPIDAAMRLALGVTAVGVVVLGAFLTPLLSATAYGAGPLLR